MYIYKCICINVHVLIKRKKYNKYTKRKRLVFSKKIPKKFSKKYLRMRVSLFLRIPHPLKFSLGVAFRLNFIHIMIKIQIYIIYCKRKALYL